MPLIIPNTTLLDSYDESTTFAGSDVFQGGYFTVANNPAAIQLGIGLSGQAAWSDEQYLPPGTYPIVPGGPQRPVSGIRARNFIAGSPCQFFGGLVYPNEPSVQAGTPYTATVSAGGAVSGTSLITGIVSGAGAIIAGTGFTVVRNAAGDYTVTFSPALSVAPVVVINSQRDAAAFYLAPVYVAVPTAASFRVQFWVSGGVPTDTQFNFLATVPS